MNGSQIKQERKDAMSKKASLVTFDKAQNYWIESLSISSLAILPSATNRSNVISTSSTSPTTSIISPRPNVFSASNSSIIR